MKTTLAAFCAVALLSATPVRADDPEPHLEAANGRRALNSPAPWPAFA